MDDNYRYSIDEKKMKFKQSILGSKRDNTCWIVIITLISFFLSASILYFSSRVFERADTLAALFILLIIVFIGIICDTVGIAVTAADEPPFHAMASKKYYGAKQAIKLVRNASKVSSVCNDVVGDICGIISGAASFLVIVRMSPDGADPDTTLYGLIIGGIVVAITVGGKAVGKIIAISNSNYIVYKVGIVLQFIIGRLSFSRVKNNIKKCPDKSPCDNDNESEMK